MAGVRYGCSAHDFPVHLITEVALAPIVQSSSWSREHGPVYRDANGREVLQSEVIANVLESHGILHFREKVSFRFEGGRVTGFSLYGAHLDAFKYIQSNEQLIVEFGKADEVRIKEAYGDLMGYEHYYAGSKKCVMWDDWDKRIYVLTLGFPQQVPLGA